MKNILVIEDDPFTIDFYNFVFKKAGFNSIVQEDGDKIIEILAMENINIIIMDINLKNTYLMGKKIDGIKLSAFIKQNEEIKHPPILLVTAYSPNLKESDFLKESLAEDFIIKPIIDFNQLINKINILAEN